MTETQRNNNVPDVLSLSERVLRGAFWQFAGTGAEFTAKIITMVVLARLLTPHEFGVAGAAMIFVSIAQVFSHVGVGPAIVQIPNLSDHAIRSAFLFSLVSGVFVAAFGYLAAGSIAGFFRMPELAAILQVISLYFVLRAPGIVSGALMLRAMRFRSIALGEALSFILGYGVAGVTAAWLGFGVWALVVATLGQVIVRSIFFMAAMPHPKAGPYELNALSRLLRYGAGFSLAQMGNFAAGQMDYLVVGRWLGAEALGLYGRAYQLLMIPTQTVGKVADKVLFSAMSSIQDERARLARGYLRTNGLVAMIAVHLTFSLIAVAPELINLALGPNWSEIVTPFRILCAVLIFRTCSKMSDSVARATGAVYRRALRQWVYAAAVFAFAFVGHHWGLIGVSIGVAISIVFNFILMLNLTTQVLPVTTTSVLLVLGRHFTAGLPFGAVVFGAVALCRSFGVGDPLTLLTAIAAGGCCVAFLIAARREIYGAEGDWLVEMISLIRDSRRSAEAENQFND